MPAIVCVWITQSTSCRAPWIAPWMTNPALLMPSSVGLKRMFPVQIQLDEARSVHLVVEQAVRIDEEGFVFAGHARADVVRAQFCHAVLVHEPVNGCQVDALFPFLLAHLLADGLAFYEGIGGHGRSIIR
jgi:hypothetical protein